MEQIGTMEKTASEGLMQTAQMQPSKPAKMSNNQRWLGVFACFTVAWGLLSLVAFTLSLNMSPERLSAQYTPSQVQYLLATPVWAVMGKAFTACGLLVGAVYILLRKESAYYWFMWSLIGSLLVTLDSVLRGGFGILGRRQRLTCYGAKLMRYT